MKKLILLPIILICCLTKGFPQQTLKSPNNRIEVVVKVENEISYSVSLNGILLIKRAEIDLIFDAKPVYSMTQKYNSSSKKINEIVTPVVSYKDSQIKNEYNLLRLDFDNNYSVEFRAFNDGVAYRHITKIDKEVEVNETANFTFNDNYKLWASPIKGYQSSYEVPYQQLNISEFHDSMNTYLPLLIEDNEGHKILMTEADIYDYPHMFLKNAGGKNQLNAIFPPFPIETKLIGDRGSKITKEADYIAKTNAKRTFPWRVMIITEKDAQLVESNLVYLLSRDKLIDNTSWIKPGRVSWDWWNASNLYGVDFKSGINTETYKYFIDFASNNGLEYIILDEGWSISTRDLSKPNPELNLDGLIEYGNKKNVKIILWATWRALNEQWYVLDHFRDWGIAGIKIDFMNRADQWMINFYEKAVKEAAKRELLVDFHGAFKPVGLRRAYPNVVSFEGVCGLEHNKWSKRITPEHDVTLPFIRMVCGPMDYTPGAMRNFHSDKFTINFFRPGSQGTRCHQIALFIVYESGIQMFADSPSNYEREQETTDFLSSVPVTWDEIKVLEAKVGEYIIVARRNGKKWFVGGLTNNIEREFTLDLSFLESKAYKATIMQDGINADRFAEDYQILEQNVSKDTKFKIKMIKGGGFAMRIE
ncbi:MAG: glycoside hydrolase family 97 protein [Bacteroidales bacterium]|nr:glycoside hydrolase family 97 protein [Bacteroidales bacterium]